MLVTTYLVYAIIILTSAAIYFIKRRLNYWKRQGIPHEEPSLLTGNLNGVMKKYSFGDIVQRVYMKFKGTGPFCGFYFFQRPGVLLLDLPTVKNIMIKDFSNFPDRGLYYNDKDDPLTGHLFFLDSQKWRTMRNKLSSTFTSGKMKFMFPTIIEVAEQFATVFDEMLEQDNVVEIKELLARFTTDVIGKCAFGLDCNSLKDPNAEFRIMGRKLFTDTRHPPIVLGLMEGFPNIGRKLGMRVLPNDVHNFFMGIVRDTVEYREKNKIQRNDFMNILLELKNGKANGEHDQLQGLTMEELAAQVFVFFAAGFETSSSTMGFTLYELAQNEEVQQKLRDEVNETLQKHENVFTYECIQEMQYMEQVIAETLRKYPIVPMLNRQALADYVVPGNPKYVIRKGMPVVIPVLGIQRDPDIYPNPDVFDPDRFAPELVKQRESVTWLPFGDGPRNCIGMRFGQMQMRVGLSYLLKRFKFSTCDQTDIPLKMSKIPLVLSTKGGIYLKVDRV